MVISAPARNKAAVFLAATAPPPTTKQGLAFIFVKRGKYSINDKATLCLSSLSGVNSGLTTHIRLQYFWYSDTAIRVLMIFHNRQ